MASTFFSKAKAAFNVLTNPAGAVTDVLEDAARQGVQRLTDQVQNDHGSEIDEHIGYMAELLKPRTFHKANGASASLHQEEATLEDFITRLDQITASGQHLFGSDFSASTDAAIIAHKRSLARLKQELDKELTHLGHHPEEAGKRLSKETEDAASQALGALRALKYKTAGQLTATAMTLASSPELSSLTVLLGDYRKALYDQNFSKLATSSNDLKAALTLLVQRKQDIFIVKSLNAQDEATFDRLRTLVEAYQQIPDSLKYTRLFNPHEAELIGAIAQTATSLQNYIKEQTGLATALLETLKKGVSSFTSALPAPSSPTVIAFSPLEKFRDALQFIQGPGQGYSEDKKKEALLMLLRLCGPEFETHFLNEVGKTDPDLTFGAAPNQDWAKNNFLNDIEVLDGAFKSALRDYARRHNRPAQEDTAALLEWSRKQTPQTPPAHAQPHRGTHALMDYAQAALDFIQGKGSFTECVIPAVGKTFKEILESELINQWIAKQPDANRVAFEQIRSTTLNALRTSTNTASYEAALIQFKTLFNAQHWILEGFELPTILQSDAEKVAQAQASQELEGTLSALRRDLDATKVKQDIDFDWTNEVKAKGKIKAQLEEFSDNLQDLFTYQMIVQTLVGVNSPNDQTFYNIKALQKSQPDKNKRSQILIKEMKTAINNSNASWITKAFAKLILSTCHKWIGYYVRNVTHHCYNNLNEHLTKLDKRDMLTRSSHCFSKYNALLKHWSTLTHGGDKLPVVNKLMRTKDYLEYEGASYSQEQLYSEVSNTFVNNHFHLLYAGQGEQTTLKGKLDQASTGLNRWILKRPFYPRNIVASTINYLAMGFKALFIGVPLHAVLLISKLVLTPFAWLSNYFTKLIARKSLTHFKVLDKTIHSARHGIYEDNPYVHVITSFLADRLEALSKELDTNKMASTSSPGQTPVVSDKTRAEIRKTLENLLEMLDKDRFQTQDQLSEHLKAQGLRQTVSKQLDQLILPGTIEALIDLTITMSNTILTEQALRQPISLLIDQFNAALTQPPTPQPSPTETMKHKAAEEKLHKYADKILHQVVNQAVDMSFDSFGQGEATLAKQTVEWVKQETPKLLNQWDAILQEINQPDKSNKERYDTLERLVTASDEFLVELQNKHDLLNAKESRTSKEMAQKLLAIVAPFKELLTGGQGGGGFLSLYVNYSHLYKDQSDLPYITTCTRCYDTIQRGLHQLAHNVNNTELKTMVFSNSHLLQQTLEAFANGKLALLKDLNHYEPAKQVVTDKALKQRRDEMTYLEGSLLPNYTAMHAIAPQDTLFNTMKNHKIAQINRYRAQGFWALFRSNKSDPWTSTYQDLAEKIQKVPSKTMREALLKALREIHGSKSHNATTSNVLKFQNLWNQYMTGERNKLIASAQRLEQIDQPIYEKMQLLATEFNDDFLARTQDNADLLPKLHRILGNMRTATEELQEISFVTGNAGVMQKLKKYPAGIVYGQLQPKMLGMVNLLKDGGFSQYYTDMVLLMPAVKS